jgi:hypothetical protein
MASSDASAFGRKNVAYRITFPILDADGDLVTGATGLDSKVSKDGGTFADATNEATEIATASGVYYLDLTSTEMNADTVAVIVKTTSSGAKTTTLVIYPLKDGDIIANITQVGGQTASASGTVTFPASISSLTAAGVRSELAVELGRIDTTIGSRLASAGYTTPPTSAAIADAVLDDAVEGSETLRQAVRLIRAAAVGKLSGAATTEITIRDAADTKARITATVDSNGNRSAVTTDAT